MGCLYKLTFPSGKAYIGITSGDTSQRFAEHVYNAKRGLDRGVNRALRKYGADAVKVETLAESDDWEALCAMERAAIVEHGTRAPAGFNMTDGGDGALGYKHTPESLKKMGAVHKGKAHHTQPHSAEARAKMSAARIGKKQSEQTRQRISEAQIGVSRGVGRKASDAHRAAIAASNRGQKRTAEQRARISIAASIREQLKREARV